MSDSNNGPLSFTWLLRCCLIVIPLLHTTSAEPVSTMLTPGIGLLDSPYWCPKTKCLYFVDKSMHEIYRWDTATKIYNSMVMDSVPLLTFVVLIAGAGDRFVVYSGESMMRTLVWDGVHEEQPIQAHKTFIMFNMTESDTLITAKADSNGLLWVVSEYGMIYSVDVEGTVTLHLSGVGSVHGIAWSVDGSKMYYADSDKSVVLEQDATLNILADEGKVVFDFAGNNVTGVPGGIAVDAEGNAWVACSGTSRIVKIDPRTGALLASVDLADTVDKPDAKITSVAFGGADLDELYVTTAEIGEGQNMGALFCVKCTGSTGLPVATFVFKDETPPASFEAY